MNKTIACLATLVCLASPAWAEGFSERDSKEIERYRLTDATFARYSQAARKLAPVMGGVACTDEDDEATSIGQVVAKAEAVPGAKAAVASAGLPMREFVVFTFSLMENSVAAMAPAGRLPPGIDAANVDFVRTHKAAIDNLRLNETLGCQDDDDSGSVGADD